MADTEMYDLLCKGRFDELCRKLDSIEGKLLSGDTPLIVRVDRLEQCKKMTARGFWIAVTAFVVGVANLLFARFKN
jgi:hypothetical protein